MSKFYGDLYFGGELFSMSGPFFGGPFFSGGFFSELTEETAESPRPSGVKRKLRILPDGRRLFASEQEAVDALLLYHHEQKLKASESAVLGLEPKKRKKIILPQERIEINAALETLKDADAKLILRRREEEWLILFH